MGVLAIPFPEIDPVALWLGPLSVKWYGLAYMAGLLLGWLYVKHLLRQDRLWPGGKRAVCAGQGRRSPALHDDRRAGRRAPRQRALLRAGLLPAKPARDPGRVEGRHGFPRRARRLHRRHRAVRAAQRRGAWSALDLCAAATPIGLFFGRLANFINAELWGRPSDVPWAFVFPGAGPMPRHASQLYEAALEGLVLFALLWWLAHARLALHKPGIVAGTFLAGYGLARSFCELFREPDFNVGPLSAGVLYSLPMVVAASG